MRRERPASYVDRAIDYLARDNSFDHQLGWDGGLYVKTASHPISTQTPSWSAPQFLPFLQFPLLSNFNLTFILSAARRAQWCKSPSKELQPSSAPEAVNEKSVTNTKDGNSRETIPDMTKRPDPGFRRSKAARVSLVSIR